MMDREFELLGVIYMRLESLGNVYSLKNAKEHQQLHHAIYKMMDKVRLMITETPVDQLTKEKLLEVVMFIQSLRYLSKGSFFQKIVNPNMNKYNVKINRELALLKQSNRELSKLALFRNAKHYEQLLDLFHYKCVFLYFKHLVITPNHSSRVSEELQDALDTMRETAVVRLDAVRKDDLWILGNHEFEKVFIPFGMNGDVQLLKHVSTTAARKERIKLMNIIAHFPYDTFLQSFVHLESNVSFIAHLQKMQPELKRLYKSLNECVIALLQLYEHFDVEPFVAKDVLDDKDDVVAMLGSLKFFYDDVEEGRPFIIERCETLQVVDTRWPERDFTVKTVHERGLLYRDHYLRKNLVTIYRLQTDNSSDQTDQGFRERRM